MALSAIALPSLAADRAGSSLLVYTDSDNVTVWKPTAAGSVAAGSAMASARWSTDFISAASVDLVSSASPRGFEEIRNQAELGGAWDFGDGRRADLRWSLSREPDFHSQAMSLSATTDLLSRRVTAVLGVGASVADVGRAGDAAFWQDRAGQDVSLQASIILARATVLDLIATSQRLSGYQASPYRFVRLYQPAAALHQTAVTEQVPTLRWRDAATVRLRHRLAPAVFGLVDYRFYADTWGMVGHTATARTIWTLPGGLWSLTAEARGHVQGAVDFYRRRYETLPQAPMWRTADKELGPMWTALGGLLLEWNPPGRGLSAFHIGLGADILHMRYLDNAFLRSRTALVTTLDLSWDR